MRGSKASSEHLMGLNFKPKLERVTSIGTRPIVSRVWSHQKLSLHYLQPIQRKHEGAKGVLPEGGNIVNLEQTPNSRVAHPYLA